MPQRRVWNRLKLCFEPFKILAICCFIIHFRCYTYTYPWFCLWKSHGQVEILAICRFIIHFRCYTYTHPWFCLWKSHGQFEIFCHLLFHHAFSMLHLPTHLILFMEISWTSSGPRVYVLLEILTFVWNVQPQRIKSNRNTAWTTNKQTVVRMYGP